MDAKSARIIKTAVKVAIAVLAYAYIAYKVATSPDIGELPSYFANISTTRGIILTIILLLMPINWLLETWKWRNLIRSEQNIGFGRCLKAVMAGVTVGTLTPNRVGEFAGRVLFVEKENRTKASYLTIFGDTAQFCTTLIFGIIGLIAIGAMHNESVPTGILIAIGASCTIVAIIVYMKFDKIVTALSNTKFAQKHLAKYIPQCDISNKQKLTTILMSMLRYVVFSIQFFLCLKFFGIDIAPSNAFAAISSTYICTYLIPSIAAAELGIRTSFAIFFIGIFTTQETAITLASLLLYLINVGMPIIIGGILLISNKTKNDNE